MGANADVVRQYVAAIDAGDMNKIAELLDDDVVVHIGGRNAMSGDHAKGPWLEMFGALMERSGGSLDVDVHDVLESDDHVVVLVRRTLAGVDARATVIYHVSDGKITELWSVELDQRAIDEAMAG